MDFQPRNALCSSDAEVELSFGKFMGKEIKHKKNTAELHCAHRRAKVGEGEYKEPNLLHG